MTCKYYNKSSELSPVCTVSQPNKYTSSSFWYQPYFDATLTWNLLCTHERFMSVSSMEWCMV